MSSKTEKPTERKKEQASKRGQSVRIADLISVLVLLTGVLAIYWAFPFPDVFKPLVQAASTAFRVPLVDYSLSILRLFLTATVFFIVLIFIVGAIPSLIASRFRIASEAIRLDFDAINPIAGFRQLYNMRTVKDSCKALVYLLIFGLVTYSFWHTHRGELLGLVRRTPPDALTHFGHLALTLCLHLLGSVALVVSVDSFFEYLLYLRELKMSRADIKQEYRETEGAPEIKSEQRRLSNEFLSGEVERAVEESSFIITNPTHIAVGLYIDTTISPLPFISILEQDERALAVMAHARRKNVPVVRHIRLARKIFKTHKRYSFVKDDVLDDITEVLTWLIDVERARHSQYHDGEQSRDPDVTDGSDGAADDDAETHRP